MNLFWTKLTINQGVILVLTGRDRGNLHPNIDAITEQGWGRIQLPYIWDMFVTSNN